MAGATLPHAVGAAATTAASPPPRNTPNIRGYHKDPITAQGITDAFRDADLLTEALDAGFSGRQPLEGTLAAYHRQSDEAAAPTFATTLQFAGLQPPPPEMQQLLAALRHNPEQINRFMGTIAGTVSPQEFFAPENLGQIMAAA